MGRNKRADLFGGSMDNLPIAGKGVRGLFSQAQDVDDGGAQEIALNKIKPNPNQMRRTFDENVLRDMAASIREHGVLQPILLNKKGNELIIIAGEQRWRASQLAGRETIPARIFDNLGDDQALALTLLENIQRKDPSLADEAVAYKAAMQQLGFASYKELATWLNKDVVYVWRRLRLAEDEEVLALVDSGELGMVAALSEISQREEASQAVQRSATHRQAEQPDQLVDRQTLDARKAGRFDHRPYDKLLKRSQELRATDIPEPDRPALLNTLEQQQAENQRIIDELRQLVPEAKRWHVRD